MAIRQTTHYVEVADTTSGNVRVSRQYVQVLGKAASEITANASDTLTLVGAANITYNLAVTDTLSLTGTGAKVQTASAASTLSLSDLLIIQFILGDRSPASSNLNLVDSVSLGSNPFPTNQLNLVDEVTFVGPRVVSYVQPLIFTDVARNTAHNIRLEDTLDLTDLARVPIELSVTSNLNLVDDATITNLTDTLNLVDSVSYGISVGVQIDDLGLTDSVALTGTWTRTITQALGIGHAMTFYVESPCGVKQYSPFTGEGFATPPDDYAPLPQVAWAESKIQLYYPSTGERTETVEIRAPELDNRDRLAFTRVNQETRGGQLISYADPIWPKLTTLLYQFIALSKTEIETVQSFFHTYLGLEVGLTDWEGREWRGVITDPDQPATEDGRRGWSLAFSFEGQRETEEPESLALSDLATVTGDWGRSGSSDLSLVDEATYLVVTP